MLGYDTLEEAKSEAQYWADKTGNAAVVEPGNPDGYTVRTLPQPDGALAIYYPRPEVNNEPQKENRPR